MDRLESGIKTLGSSVKQIDTRAKNIEIMDSTTTYNMADDYLTLLSDSLAQLNTYLVNHTELKELLSRVESKGKATPEERKKATKLRVEVENMIAIIETPIEKVMYYHKMSESLKASADYHMAFYNEQIERLEEKLKTNPKNRKAAEEAIEKNREWVSELKQTMKTIEVNEKLFSNYMMQKGLLDILVGISEDILEKKKEDVYEPRERKPDPSYS